MTNPERLAELQRQRALVREQLAWLDREITAASRDESAFVAPRPPSPPAPGPADLSAADLDAYQPDPATAAAEVRRGCLRYACAALLLGALALTAIYFVHYRDRTQLTVHPEKNSPTAKPPLPPPAQFDVPRK